MKAVRNISISENALTFTWSDGRQPHVVCWNDIEEIETYKVDLLTHDNICLAFRAGGIWHEISEEDPMFRQVVSNVESHFPTIPKDWFHQVMLPPFQENARQLWPKANQSSERTDEAPAAHT